MIDWSRKLNVTLALRDIKYDHLVLLLTVFIHWPYWVRPRLAIPSYKYHIEPKRQSSYSRCIGVINFWSVCPWY